MSCRRAAHVECSVVCTDLTGLITAFSPGSERLLGWRSADVIGRMSLVEFHDREEVADRAAQLGVASGFEALVGGAAAGADEPHEWTYLCADGGRVPVSSTIGALRSGDQIVGFMAIASDVRAARDLATEHSAATERAGAAERMWAVFHASPVPSVITRMADGMIVQANPACLELLGWEEAEFLGRTMEDMGFWTAPDRRQRMLERLHSAGRVRNLEEDIRTKRGATLTVLMSISTVVLEDERCLIGHIHDITERRRLESKLHDSEERFRQVTETVQQGFMLSAVDPPAILYASPGVAHIFGVGGDVLREDPLALRALIHPDDRERVLAARNTMSPRNVEFRIVRPDGETRWIKTSAEPVRVSHGQAPRIASVSEDVTEERALREALRESEQRFRLLVDSIKEDYAIIMLDPDGCVASWNAGAQRIKGYAAEEIVGRHFAALYPPELVETGHPQRELELAIAQGRYQEEGVRVRKDGSRFWADVTLTPIYDEAGELRGFAKITRDITERRRVDEMLERQRRQLVEAQSLGEFGSWDWDLATDTIEWSAELYRINGLQPRDEPMTFEEGLACVHPDDRARVQAEVQAALTSGEPFTFEHRLVRPDGSVRVCEARGDVIRDDDGVPLRMLGIEQDITKRREVERAKDEFTSVVSHELRTPLTSIRGSLGLLESGVLGRLSAQGQRMVEIAVQNTDRLVRLINDILDIERINCGDIDMHPQPCVAGELIERAIDAVASTAAAAQVTVSTDVEPVWLSADADRVIQTLTNLLSNAVKFSPADSSVRVSCARQGEQVLFEVSDCGRGIPADKLSTIFERFQQVDASDSREKGGTGLGLAICRSIVEQHGGRIWADSAPGAGATFSFTLPALIAHDATAHTVVDPDRPRVLLCDDDPCVTEVVSAALKQRDYHVTAVQSGEQALDRALAEPPDAILLDLLMPGMSGWETAAALKRHDKTKAIPIVILSVLAQAETAAPDGSVVGWVQKPLDDAQLFAALERAVAAHDEPLKVLIVEDDEDLARILAATFDKHGVQTFHAANGAHAIDISQRVLPDLLVLDLGLPEVDGFEVVAWLRRHQRLHATPMVVYSARDLDESDRARLTLGTTTQFLTKGHITPQDFEQRVIALLSQLTAPHTPPAGAADR